MTFRRRWIARGLISGIAFAGAAMFFWIERARPLLVPLLLLVLAITAILGLVLDSIGEGRPDWSTLRIDELSKIGQDRGLAANVRMIEDHLNARVAGGTLRRRLARLTDDRLARMGLTRTKNDAADHLGSTLRDVLDGPPRKLRLAEIEECVKTIEELME